MGRRRRLQREAVPADEGTMTRRQRLRLFGSRGVSVVEYALIVSVFVFGSLGAIKTLNTRSGAYYNSASNDIGDLPQGAIDTSDEGTIPTSIPTPPSSTSSTSTTSTTTTTTTTTTTSTTTTTTSTTTTTVPTTTSTTTAAKSTINQITDISTNASSNRYNATVRVKITNTNTGAAISGATVSIYFRDDDGNTTTKTCVTASDGRCSSTWLVSDWRAPVLAYVYNVSSSPAWDQNAAYTYLYHP